jgi:hypothetical protein
LDYYYFFFDWKIRESDCVSPRTMVTATVEPGLDVTVSDDVTIIAGESTTLTASGGVTYSWSPTIGLDDPTSATPVASPTETTVYTVTVTDADGCSGTADVTVFVEGELGITESAEGFDIYPNPSNGLIYISAENLSWPYTIEVLTVDGKLVYSEEQQEQKDVNVIDLSGFSDGIYYIRLSNEDFEYQEKVVLQ